MGKGIIDSVISVVTKVGESKLIAALLAVVLAWQLAVAASNLFQLVLQPAPEQSYVLYTAPQYEEELLNPATWDWSKHRELRREKVLAPPPPPPPPPPPVELQVQLLGILNRGEQGFAMMKVDNDPEKLYAKGEVVKGNIRLTEINLESVVLSDGARETTYQLHQTNANIFLERPESAPPPPPAAPPPQPQPAAPVAAPANPPRTISVAALPKSRRDRFDTFRKRVEDNPLALANDVSVNQVDRNGQVYGYSVNYRIDPILLRSIGLLPTDVIISVNDFPASQIANDPNLQSNLMSQTNFVIVYDRRGVINTLRLNL